MFEATGETITNPDAALFKLIAKYDEMSAESAGLDEMSRNARRQGDLSRADQLSKRCEDTFHKACGLQWELILKDAMTAEGHVAKVRMVASSDFDADDLVRIAWELAYEAARLGLSKTMPRLQPPAVPLMAAAG